MAFYKRTDQGMIVEQVTGEEAIWTGDGWRMTEAESFDVQGARGRALGTVDVAPGVTPAQIAISRIAPEAQPFGQLTDSIDALAAGGRRTAELEAKWWHKISGPLSSLLMPLLGSVAAFGLARSGHLFVRAVIAMALGFAYFVVDNAALAIGGFGAYSPLLAAWAPFFLFLLLGETLLIRTEE